MKDRGRPSVGDLRRVGTRLPRMPCDSEDRATFSRTATAALAAATATRKSHGPPGPLESLSADAVGL